MTLGNRQDHRLQGGEPNWKSPGKVLDEKTNGALVGAQQSPMDAQRRFLLTLGVSVHQADPARYGKVHLIGRQGKLPPDRTPHLDVDFGPVERGRADDLDPCALLHMAHARQYDPEMLLKFVRTGASHARW